MPFSYKNQITLGEKTPGYFRTSFVPKRVFDMNPKIKLIIIIREPVERKVSSYTHIFGLRL